MAEGSASFEQILDAIRAATMPASPPDRRQQGYEGGSVFVSDQVERITYHDFATYQTVFDPWATRDPRQDDGSTKPAPSPPQDTAPPPPHYLPADLVDLDDLSSQAEAAVRYFLDTEVREALQDGVDFDPAPIVNLIFRFRFVCGQELIRHYQPGQIPARVESLLIFFIENFLADLIEPFQRMNPAQQADFFTRYYDQAVRDWVIRGRNMEMPWAVRQRTIQEWTGAGYQVGEAYGRVPTSLSLATSGQGVYTIAGWVTGQHGDQPLAHEYAWTHDRNVGSSGQVFTGGIYAWPNDPSSYFAPFQTLVDGHYVAQSSVLAGANAILAIAPTVTPTEEEQLTAAARQALSQ
jgi:hypothetical protein